MRAERGVHWAAAGAECRARAWSAWGAWGQSVGCIGVYWGRGQGVPGAEREARIWGIWGVRGQSMGCMGCWGAEGGVRVQRLAPDRRHVSEAVASAVPSAYLASTVLEGRV